MAGKDNTKRNEDRIARLLKRLGKRTLAVQPVAETDGYRLVADEQSAGHGHMVDRQILDLARRRDLIAAPDNSTVRATPAGIAWLRRRLSGADGFQNQHRDLQIRNDLSALPVTENERESPLVRMRRRRGSGGEPMIDDMQFTAGERLRQDFTKAHLNPRVTSNWAAPIHKSGRRSGDPGGLEDATHAALAARDRFNAALAAVGTDLSGLLVDVCCFLKGLEEVEKERQWPARSAKVVIAIALNRLADYYGLSPTGGAPRRGQIDHWGSDDFRPPLV